MYSKLIKPLLDFFSSLLGLIVLSPLLLFLIVLLSISNKGKPFFLQTRAGKFGKPFKIIKFKTMTDEKDENGRLLPFQERVTKLGDFVRKLSLDEIPQLINVLKGDMSIVGPRPLHMEYLPHYNETQAKRHNVVGGITGWAQVNGRNTITWEQKFNYDIWYVNNVSFLVDLKIIWLTVLKVIQKKDVNDANDGNMTAFGGADVD